MTTPKLEIPFSFANILEAISDALVVLDKDMNCIFINDEALSIFAPGRKTSKSILGKSFNKLATKLKNKSFNEMLAQSKREGKRLLLDLYVDHSKKWYKTRIYPDNQLFLILMRNNTDEVNLFNEIKESEEYHRTLIENVKDYAIFVLDEKGKIKTWNKGAERLLGYTAGEVIGKNPFIFYQKDSRKNNLVNKQLMEVKLEGKFEQEGWWVRKDGSQFWGNEILAYFKDENGNMRGYTKVVRDMTDRKNTEEMLKRYTRDLERSTRAVETEVAKDEALLDSIGEGVVATDETGRIVVFNKQAQSLLGWSQDEAIGELYYNVWKIENEEGDSISNDIRPVAMALRHGKKIIDSGYYYSSAYRKPFPVSMTTSPVILEGETIGAVMVFRDISKEKEVDRAKSEFVSLASHQLRTPLTAIKLFVEMLCSNGASNMTPEQLEMIQSINESNQKMIKLVENLLNVSRLETGVLTVKLEQIVLKDFILEVVRELEPVASSKQCNIVLSISNMGNTKITTDPVLLRQILNNLLNNAISYSFEDRESNIYVETIIVPGQQYKILVRDEGIGISKEALPNVFQRFYRADNAVKARTDGNGLGLYMCKMMTETLGGKIACSSKLNMGTVFTLTFPLNKSRRKAEVKKVKN